MDRPILYINACVRKESRTRKLAEKLLLKLDEPFEEICLENVAFPVVNEDFLSKRDRLISQGEYQDPLFELARQFSNAAAIVIAAPFWDLSFPASLKQYLEQINVTGNHLQILGRRHSHRPLQGKKIVLCDYSRRAICPGELWLWIC